MAMAILTIMINVLSEEMLIRSWYMVLIWDFRKGVDFSMFWQGGHCRTSDRCFRYGCFPEGATNLNTWEYFGDRWHRADYTDPNSEWIPGIFRQSEILHQ